MANRLASVAICFFASGVDVATAAARGREAEQAAE
jgi:hypothetical protein